MRLIITAFAVRRIDGVRGTHSTTRGSSPNNYRVVAAWAHSGDPVHS
jgi:hypothetical protein